MNISIIIVNFNGFHYTRQCIESFYQYNTDNNHEVIVVDNNSTDGSQQELPKHFPQIVFISLKENRGFGAANNIGANIAKGEGLFFVNNDTIFQSEVVEKLSNILSSNESYGIIGPKLLNEDKSFQLSFGQFPTIRTEFTTKNQTKIKLSPLKEMNQLLMKEWVTGAAMMIKKELFERIGGFDDHFFMYFEDIDLCKNANKIGYQSVFVPFVSMIHFGGKSYVKENNKILFEYRRSQLRYYDKHNSILQRILLRVYIFLKYSSTLFSTTEYNHFKRVLKLIFSIHK